MMREIGNGDDLEEEGEWHGKWIVWRRILHRGFMWRRNKGRTENVLRRREGKVIYAASRDG